MDVTDPTKESTKISERLSEMSVENTTDCHKETYLNCDNQIPSEEKKNNDSCDANKPNLLSNKNNVDATKKQYSDSDDEYFSADEEECDGDDEDDDKAEDCGDVDNDKGVKDDDDDKGVKDDDDGDDDGDDDDDDEEDCEADKINEEEYRRSLEETLSDDEKLERKEKSQELKDAGNTLFRENKYTDAIDRYTEALKICPYSFPKERSIMFSNRGACHVKLENNEEAIEDCSSAIELHPHYLKPVLRRAELYEKTEKLDDALKDYHKVVELDPSQTNARITAMRLADQIKDRNEKMKTEMMGKLKDLGNLVLKPFGLSTDNFQVQQDPESGGYSMNFKQN